MPLASAWVCSVPPQRPKLQGRLGLGRGSVSGFLSQKCAEALILDPIAYDFQRALLALPQSDSIPTEQDNHLFEPGTCIVTCGREVNKTLCFMQRAWDHRLSYPNSSPSSKTLRSQHKPNWRHFVICLGDSTKNIDGEEKVGS